MSRVQDELPQFSAGPSMDDSNKDQNGPRLSTLKKSYPGAPPPANWFPEGLNVISAAQVSQATIPQFFNFIGSSSGMMPPTVQISTGMEQNTSVPDLYQTVVFPPKLLETYSQQMEKVRGSKLPQPTVREPERSIPDEDQYSGTEVSSREAAQIREQVQGIMNQHRVQARANAEAISKLEQKIAAQESKSKSVNTTAGEDEVIDLISKSAASMQKTPPTSITRFPNLGSQYPFPCWEWWERSGIFPIVIGVSPLASPATVRHHALEAKRASMLFRT